MGRDLRRCLLRFADKHRRIGKAIESAAKAYNEAVGVFDDAVLSKGRRFVKVVVGEADESPLRFDAVDGHARTSECVEPSAGEPA